MYRLVIFLDELEADALRTLALREYRDIRSQAALILKEELTHRQLLRLETDPIQSTKHTCQTQQLTDQSYMEEDNESKDNKPTEN
jgi:hypothetical protein